MEIANEPLLGCGRSLDSIWEALEFGPDAHQKECPYCQEAWLHASSVEEATRELRDSDVEDTTLSLDSNFTRKVMDIARAEIRRGRKIPILEGPAGNVTVSEQTLTALVRSALEDMPEVHARRCRIDISMREPSAAGENTVLRTGETMKIDLRVATLSTVEIRQTAEKARQLITQKLMGSLGTRIDAVNITVEDIFND